MTASGCFGRARPWGTTFRGSSTLAAAASAQTTAFVGGLLTVAILALRRSPLAAHVSGNRFLRNLADARVGVPYGIALGIGGLLTYPASAPMAWALARLAAH